MGIQQSLLGIIDAGMRSELRDQCRKDRSLKSKLILELLSNNEPDERRIREKYGISAGTLQKTLSLVKDHLWNFMRSRTDSPYDDVFLLRKLLLAGEISSGAKVIRSLEKEYEARQLWHQLDLLYVEGFRLAQITGDEKLIREFAGKRKKNSIRLNEYTQLYSDIMVEMVRLEGFKIKKPEAAQYPVMLQSLYSRALSLRHFLLVHNALHLRYLYSVHYRNDPPEVFQIITLVNRNAEKNRKIMNEITYAIALNNYVNFLTIYRSFGEPDAPAAKLKKIIAAGGGFAVANFYYSMLEYSLFRKMTAEADKWLNELKKAVDTSKFAQYRYIILSIRAFLERDYKVFRENFNKFYNDPTHLDFPDMAITLRLLEIIYHVHRQDGDIAMSKADALRVYMGRNMNMDRYADERRLLSVVSRINEGSRNVKKELDKLMESEYRNVCFLAGQVKEVLSVR